MFNIVGATKKLINNWVGLFLSVNYRQEKTRVVITKLSKFVVKMSISQ